MSCVCSLNSHAALTNASDNAAAAATTTPAAVALAVHSRANFDFYSCERKKYIEKKQLNATQLRRFVCLSQHSDEQTNRQTNASAKSRLQIIITIITTLLSISILLYYYIKNTQMHVLLLAICCVSPNNCKYQLLPFYGSQN